VKYLVVMLVVGVVVWLLTAKARPSVRDGGEGGAGRRGKAAGPVAMLACAHCGVHLPAADAVLDGSRVYCSEAHRSRGPSGAA